MSRKTDLVTLALRSCGLNPKVFAPEKLGIEYQLFRYRMRKGNLKLSDYHTIIFYTGRTFQELWPSPLEPNHKPIKLNLSSDQLNLSPPVSRPSPPKEKEPVMSTPSPSPDSGFVFVDPYDGLLPDLEQPNI